MIIDSFFWLLLAHFFRPERIMNFPGANRKDCYKLIILWRDIEKCRWDY